MRLADLLTVDRIDIQLSARDKVEALLAISGLLASGPYPSSGEAPMPPEEVQRVLVERERVASTGMGEGVAIPHGRLAGVTRFVGALAIAPRGVPFDAIDGRPAVILFGLIGPERAAGEHLKCLARISRLLRDESVRTRLLRAETPAAALHIVLEVDGGGS